MLKNVFISFILIIFFYSCQVVEPDNPTYLNETNFTDPEFAAAVHQNLASWMALSEITAQNAVQLSMTDRNISDISGIEIFTNLVYLELNYNNIIDIAPLTNLDKLYTLYCILYTVYCILNPYKNIIKQTQLFVV